MPPALTDDMLAVCTLSRWDGHPETCRWCGEMLPTGRPRFCSRSCRDRCAENHQWAPARFAACLRDGWTCQMCWRGPALDALMRWLLPTIGPLDWRRLAVEDPALAAEWWEWTSISPEVDHVFPVFGLRGTGCQNHLEGPGLRVLCHDCHVAETARWRGIRRAMLACFDIDLAAPAEEPVTIAA